MSKFSLDVLERRVFPFAEAADPDIILGAAFGEDVALTRVGGDILVSHIDPIVGAIGNIGWLAVHVACNDIATAGVRPHSVLLLVLVSRVEDEDLLERIMRDASRAAGEIGPPSSEATPGTPLDSPAPWSPSRLWGPHRDVSPCERAGPVPAITCWSRRGLPWRGQPSWLRTLPTWREGWGWARKTWPWRVA